MQHGKWIDMRDLIPEIIANYKAGRGPEDQRDKDLRDFAEWESQPDPEPEGDD